MAQIVPAADPASRSFLVKIGLPPDARFALRACSAARVSPAASAPRLLIPQTRPLSMRGQLQGVYVIGANQIAGLRYVTLGQTAGQQVEVLSGLQSGEKLIAAPGARELGGKQIAAQP